VIEFPSWFGLALSPPERRAILLLGRRIPPSKWRGGKRLLPSMQGRGYVTKNEKERWCLTIYGAIIREYIARIETR
jgi:hypothetical protein